MAAPSIDTETRLRPSGAKARPLMVMVLREVIALL